MLRFLAQSLLTLLGNTIGLVAAALLLPEFHLSAQGFITSVIFFTIAQIILGPFILKMTIKYAPAFRGGIALVTVLAVLIITSTFTDGLTINGFLTWAVAPLVIWFTTVLAGILLPLFLFKELLSQRKSSRRNKPTTLQPED